MSGQIGIAITEQAALENQGRSFYGFLTSFERAVLMNENHHLMLSDSILSEMHRGWTGLAAGVRPSSQADT